jgi:uncharacterized membrane protein
MIVLSLLIGFVAGLRAMTAPAAASWAAYLGALPLEGTWLAVLGYAWTPWILTLLAVVELGTDQLPGMPSRMVPVQFGTRIVTGGIAGAAFGSPSGSLLLGAVAGAVGAILGTVGGAAARGRLARAFGRDLPAALVEDAVAIGCLAVLVIVVVL